MRYAITVFLLAALLTGCIQTEATMLSEAPTGLSPVDTSQIALHADTSSLDCEYSNVAIIRTQGGQARVSDKKMIHKAKAAAGKNGGNALVIETLETDKPDVIDTGSRQGRFIAVYEHRPCP